MLLHRLERQFGLRVVVLPGSRRNCMIDVSSLVAAVSSVIFIVCSVPRGSVLGPRPFVLYTADLADAIHHASIM